MRTIIAITIGGHKAIAKEITTVQRRNEVCHDHRGNTWSLPSRSEFIHLEDTRKGLNLSPFLRMPEAWPDGWSQTSKKTDGHKPARRHQHHVGNCQ
jgi:hypothetical protein